mgnify:CR=1 FL=1
MKLINRYSYGLITFLAIAGLFMACTKEIEKTSVYPGSSYEDISFLSGLPTPSRGGEGSVVSVKVKGLKGREGNFKFYVGELEAEVLSVADSSITFKIPVDAITSTLYVKYQDKFFFGPDFIVRGKVLIDPAFAGFTGALNNASPGTINDILPDGQDFIIAGLFDNYANAATAAAPIINLAKITNRGAFQSAVTRGTSSGVINSITKLPIPIPQYLVSGVFSEYNTRKGVNGIAGLLAGMALDTVIIDVINPEPVLHPLDGKDTVATFNGGVLGSVLKTFVTTDNKYIAVGNFSHYVSHFYERSTRDNKLMDLVPVSTIMRMNADGSLDSTFNYDLVAHRGNPAANGSISSTVQISDKRIILAGSFIKYNDVDASRIVAVNESDGSINTSFNVGSGADGVISQVSYNALTGKLVVVGEFRNFNGRPANGIVVLNSDGSFDNTFNLQNLEGGRISFGGQLEDGRIIITGSFKRYAGKGRPGIAVLNADGSLAPGYNSMGAFEGQINKMIEVVASSGNVGVILVGQFSRFDNVNVNSIVFLELMP